MLTENNSYLEEAAETAYQLTAEEKIRLQCEARENYYRQQSYIKQQIAKSEAEREAAFTKLDKAIAERDVAVMKNETLLAQIEMVIAERDAMAAKVGEVVDRLEKMEAQYAKLLEKDLGLDIRG